MFKTYKKPVITIDDGLSEGVYAASGATEGTLDVQYMGVWDRWTNGGKGLATVSWSNITGTITLNVTFNDTVDQIEVSGISATTSISAQTATITFSGQAGESFTLGIHLDHGTSIDNLQMTGFTYSVN